MNMYVFDLKESKLEHIMRECLLCVSVCYA
jgi:hypothetical protein